MNRIILKDTCMSRVKSLLIAASLLLVTGRGLSQSVIPGTELFQMVKLAETYRYIPNLSFDIDIRYTDSLDVDSVIEQVSGNYKLHGGLYYTYIDSTEIVQGSRYSLKISHWDSVISVRDRQDYPDVMNMPVTDTLYWATFTQGITLTNVNDSVRTLKIRFKPGALYSSYEVRYNFKTFLMEQVKCYMPAGTPGVDPGSFPSGKGLITFTFSNYSTAPVSGAWFSEDKFIVYQDGQFVPRPDYTGYFVETNITQ
ncbi:MAG: hypothetical protein KF862_16680 [Chitinophagaceae bacterium]|nr:hypothetical protein [Chitinophagaceae bacterium]